MSIPLLVALLDAGAESAAPQHAAGTLVNLTLNSNSNQEAIREAGGIPPLVALLGAGAESAAAEYAAGALMNLADNNTTSQEAIREAGGIPSLVALLDAGAESEAAEYVVQALEDLACDNATNGQAILGVLPSTMPVVLGNEERFVAKLQAVASSRLEAAETGSDVDALERAIERGQAVRLAADVLQRASARVADINSETARKAKRESLGLGHMAPPNEFFCPITFEVMRDPVVASDGNSYERVAIKAVLRSGNGLSPLSREPLASALFPNRNLRQRIVAHEGEVLDFASQAAEVVAGRAVAEVLGEQSEGGGRKRAAELVAGEAGSSAGDAAGGRPKRSRRAT